MPSHLRGSANPNWKGGRIVDPNGYVLVRVGVGHHLADVRGYVYEHRLVAERTLGRRLMAGEVVHHRDENKQNNIPDNLEVVTRPEHNFHHREKDIGLRKPGEQNVEIGCACGCTTRFMKFRPDGRPRRFVSGHNRRRRADAQVS